VVKAAKAFARSMPSVMIGIALLAAAQSSSAATKEAEALIQRTTDDLLALIEEAKVYVDEDPDRFYLAVEKLLEPVIDFPRFARSVMAVHYKAATPEQRDRFTEGFKSSLVKTYALALTEFNDGAVTIIPSDRPARRPDRASVKQEIRSSGQIYPVVYSLALSKEGEWRLMNIIIDGINMGLTYRSQFASAVKDARYDGDMDKVIDGWVESLYDDDDNVDEAKEPEAAQVSTH